MVRFIVQRAVHGLLVMIGVTFVVFVLVRLSGDPVRLMLPLDAPAEQVQMVRSELGLDQPLVVQFWRFVTGAARGDFGDSLRHRQPALDIVLERLPATLWLSAFGLGASVLIGVPAGVLAAVRRGGIVDRSLTVLALSGQSMPSFTLGMVLILIGAVQLRWFPASGAGTWKHLVLPGLSLGAFSAALIYRLTRSSMLEVLSRDYVRTATAKGAGRSLVVWRHAFRNAALPVITVVGIQLSGLIGGAVVVESVFAYPGMGLAAIQAINNRDFPIVQAFVFVLALVVTIVNFATDMMYSRLNPNIRYR